MLNGHVNRHKFTSRQERKISLSVQENKCETKIGRLGKCSNLMCESCFRSHQRFGAFFMLLIVELFGKAIVMLIINCKKAANDKTTTIDC